jgi:hypothetical protein
MKNRRSLAYIIGICLGVPVMAGAAEITLYEGPNFQGRSMTFRSEANNLDPIGFNDRASSIVVRDGVWEGCSDAYFQGNCTLFRPGDYPQLDGQANRRISSLRVMEGQPIYHSSGSYSDSRYYAHDGYRADYYDPNRAYGYDRGYYGYPYHDHGQ